MKAIVVIPTYDEKDNVQPMSVAVLANDGVSGVKTELLFVDDNSPDGTGKVIDSLVANDPRVHVLHREKKAGLGRAYVAGFAKALAAVNKVTNINVEMVEDVFDEAGDLLAEAGDTDKFWSQMYGKEVEGSKSALQDHIPSMEDLEKTLQEEVAGKVKSSVDPSALEKEL